ncbi:MAG: PilZ domain-containing protein [Candidatus Hydrogenedentes bacterium]|nr:PilZ domain-containing protein [Candidatus Hydrogenedentota bacterium]
MLEDRRKFVRRASDRQLLSQVQNFQGQVDGEVNRELRQKRRRAIRHTCTVKISVQVGHRSGASDTWNMTDHPVAGRLLDLSTDGCQLYTRDLLDIGAQLNLLITLQSGEEIRAVGVVRWNKAVPEKNGYGLGVQFTRADHDAQTRIQNFIHFLDQTGGL